MHCKRSLNCFIYSYPLSSNKSQKSKILLFIMLGKQNVFLCVMDEILLVCFSWRFSKFTRGSSAFHNIMRNKQVQFNPYIYTFSNVSRFGYEISVLIHNRAVLRTATGTAGSYVTATVPWRKGCQKFFLYCKILVITNGLLINTRCTQTIKWGYFLTFIKGNKNFLIK